VKHVRQVSYPIFEVLGLNGRMHKTNPKNQRKLIGLIPLLVRVKTAPSVQHQLDLLCEAGEFRSFKIHPLSDRERLAICPCCGAVTTPWGKYGDLLELEFLIQGFQFIFKSRELWEGGRDALSQRIEEPRGYHSNLNRQIGRLRLKRLPIPIRPVKIYKRPQCLRSEVPVHGLSSFHILKAAQAVQWIPITATSYSWREFDHRIKFKFALNQPVEGLQQCAADLSIYPEGSILCIKTNDGEEFRIVTHTNPGIEGAYQIDLHFDSLTEMDAKGTRRAELIVVRLGWNAGSVTQEGVL
jgi:3D (Asp-Asp-Asp) domain-containing protein